MCVLSYQCVLFPECLITHITNIRALTTMCVLMYYQAVHCMPYYTYHRYKGAHYYV